MGGYTLRMQARRSVVAVTEVSETVVGPEGIAQSETTTIEQMDVALGKELATKRGPVIEALRKVGKLGDQEPLYIVGSAVLALGLATRRAPLAKTGLAVLAAVATADASKSLAKNLVHRTRPHVLMDEGRYKAGVGKSEKKPEQSFPSGHVAGSLAASIAVARQYPLAGVVGCLLTAMMGVGRVVRRAHWPLDIAAGAVIGVIAEGVSSRVLRLFGLRNTRE